MTDTPARRPLPDWIQQHLADYAADPDKGHDSRGVPALLLTTTGRKSGATQTLPLFYGEDDGRYLIVASIGGAPKHPAWYLNLVANPDVEVQVRHDRFAATARTANDDEKPALWEKMVKIFPNYAEYQQKTTRVIPVVILERK